MLANQDDILRFIPQRNPMVMVHALLEASDDHAVTQLTINPDNVFVAAEYFAEPGLVENIAQTAAVHVGYRCSLIDTPIPIGYIAAVKNLRIEKLPGQNSVITTSVKVINQVLDITMIQGKIEQNGKLLCSCEMRIFAKLQS
ncbi:MAG: 3-hydroxyacyl-ACP dehydratase [Cyclobacteriaceae bacterium]|nr:3-hydroxyacyl-ACP dehydratase [Cyclobacteriaceae bacterium]MDH4296216.1 3-hydroxyacyl-ACP dehydratase [Cyclobacteriaceae bacterium]